MKLPGFFGGRAQSDRIYQRLNLSEPPFKILLTVRNSLCLHIKNEAINLLFVTLATLRREPCPRWYRIGDRPAFCRGFTRISVRGDHRSSATCFSLARDRLELLSP